ncbi:MAG: ATP-binding protein [Alphaproteobacteria bacterium]|nr:MAG: ATP-binding protein [Alphaproteobacteria bacterium]
MNLTPLPPEKLTVRFDPGALGFESTEELEDLDVSLGQSRALEAIEFGADMPRPGYNLFLLGSEGAGKYETIMARLSAKAADGPAPDDWVYVNNFEVSHKPRAIRLPNGRGKELAEAMARLVEDVRGAVPSLFEREENQRRLQEIQEEFQQKQQDAFDALRKKANERSIALIRTPMGFGFAPMRNDEVMKPEVFEKLPESERRRIEQDIEALQAELQDIVRQIPAWDRERRAAMRDLNREIVAFAVDSSIELIRDQFKDLPQVVDYLAAVRADLVENFASIMAAEQAASQAQAENEETVDAGRSSGFEITGFDRYRVNVLVGDESGTGAPVVYADNPTMPNLIGRVEHVSRYGALVTDFTLIKPGALHRANGGYLVIDARQLLMQPLSWEALKRALKARSITIESPAQMLSLVSTISLEPEPIPLDVKVALFGDRFLYYMLSQLDPEFLDLFKVEADFDDELARSPENELAFARLIATLARRAQMRPFDAAGVARVMEQAVRIAGDATKLTLHRRSLVDLMQESDFFATREGAARITDTHVQQAIDAQIRRADRIREKSHEAITRDIVLIDTEGAEVGQINGLAVLQLGRFAFGRPSRITARVRLGSGKLIDIEREAKLGGPLHSKGVLILSGFLQARYAVDSPFSLAATLVFEQSYGGVDGDSASSAELYALLSALSGLPIRQDLAVTGSVNQRGQVQAIGGVNEKIEGFFDICAARGLTGNQGVLIPKANVEHLSLRGDVIEAVKSGKFAVYAVETIDQGIALLTGCEAGERGSDGAFPADSVNGLVEQRLRSFARARQAFGRQADGEPRERSGS